MGLRQLANETGIQIGTLWSWRLRGDKAAESQHEANDFEEVGRPTPRGRLESESFAGNTQAIQEVARQATYAAGRRAMARQQVFLSYARLDAKNARKLCKDLRSGTGARVWFDQDDLLPGMKWRPAIRKAIREADYFVALLSKQATAGRGFRHTELREALTILSEFSDDTVFVIPARLDNCKPPVGELSDLTYADLFPDWHEGVARLCKSMGLKLKSVANSKARGGNPRTGARQVKKLGGSKASSPPTTEYQYRIGLVDLDGRITLEAVARGLNKRQRFFHFEVSRLQPNKTALRSEQGLAQLDLDRLSARFYGQISPLAMDHVIGVTRRYLMFEDKNYVLYNYLGSPSPVDDRVMFSSIGGLEGFASDAGVSLDAALAYVMISQLASYFLDLDYHRDARACPLDFTEDHSEMVEGLRLGRMCPQCSKALAKNPELGSAFRDMLAWGR